MLGLINHVESFSVAYLFKSVHFICATDKCEFINVKHRYAKICQSKSFLLSVSNEIKRMRKKNHQQQQQQSDNIQISVH